MAVNRTSQRVLVVDDEEHIRELCSLYLEREGFQVESVGNGEEALGLVRSGAPDLVVLDVMLPGMDGLAVCREIRKESQVPVIMLTARDEITDKVVGLELGADDYLTTPFAPQELVARAKALLRRAHAEPDEPKVTRAGALEVDLERHEVRYGDRRVQLRPKEFDLLALLARNPGRAFARDYLIEKVWGYDAGGFDRTVDTHVLRLRKKLGAVGERIETVWGIGYRFAKARDS